LALRTWVSGPQREVSGPGSQDLGFRPSVFGFQDLSFRTSKVLHPTVVLSFSRHFSFSHHFSLRPVVTDGRTPGLREFIYKTSGCPWPKATVNSPVGARDLHLDLWTRRLRSHTQSLSLPFLESRFPNPTVRAGSPLENLSIRPSECLGRFRPTN
jgi:hypothetical protein